MSSSLLSDVRAVIESNGFSTLLPEPNSTYCHFEDASLMGFVQTYPSVAELLAGWMTVQDTFLSVNADRFIKASEKTWNLYVVLLTNQQPTAEERPKLFAIEEDFRAARKIARAGIVSHEDLMAVLAPLLQLRIVPSLGISDVKQQLSDRLTRISSAFRGVTTDATPEMIFASLTGEE